MPYFTPPIAYDLPPTLPGRGIINSHAKWKGGQRRGRSVLKKDGVYTLVDVPTVDQTTSADIYYAGGHVYEISDQEYYDLIAAGFPATLGLGTNILTEQAASLDTETGEALLDESGDVMEWQTLTPVIEDEGILLTEAGDTLMSEFVNTII